MSNVLSNGLSINGKRALEGNSCTDAKKAADKDAKEGSR